MANGIVTCGGYSDWGQIDPKEVQKMMSTQKQFEKTVCDSKLGWCADVDLSSNYETAIFGISCLMLHSMMKRLSGDTESREDVSNNFCDETASKAHCLVPVFGR